MRQLVRGENFPDALHRDRDAGTHERQTHDSGSQRFSLAMTVGMILVARLDGVAQADIDDRRAEHIREGLKAVGDESEGMPHNAARDFHRREDAVEPQSGDYGFMPLG